MPPFIDVSIYSLITEGLLNYMYFAQGTNLRKKIQHASCCFYLKYFREIKSSLLPVNENFLNRSLEYLFSI